GPVQAAPGPAHRPGLRQRRPAVPGNQSTRLRRQLLRRPRLPRPAPPRRGADAQVRAFAVMLARLTGHDLPQWISGARAAGLPGLSSFAKGLEQDLDAVTAGLTTRWNSGPVEGRVNHIKMIKRQMFGRAGLPLLRKRVLLTAQNRPATRAVS